MRHSLLAGQGSGFAYAGLVFILALYPVSFGYFFVQSSRFALFSTSCLLTYVLALTLVRMVWTYLRDARTRALFPYSSLSQCAVSLALVGFSVVLASFVGVALYVAVHW